MRSAIVIAQHGQPQLTIACVQSLRRQHGEEPPVVVVDDGSAPGDIELVASAGLNNVELLRRSRRGVTSAWNAGAAKCSAEVLVFLNNDVVTTGPWINRLCEPLRDQRCIVVGVAHRRERHLDEQTLGRLPTRVFASGWCFAVRRADFEAVDGFRVSLRLYFSDTDLQARLLRQSGCGSEAIATVTRLGLRHLGHATTSLCDTRKEQWLADPRRFVRLWSGAACWSSAFRLLDASESLNFNRFRA